MAPWVVGRRSAENKHRVGALSSVPFGAGLWISGKARIKVCASQARRPSQELAEPCSCSKVCGLWCASQGSVKLAG